MLHEVNALITGFKDFQLLECNVANLQIKLISAQHLYIL